MNAALTTLNPTEIMTRCRDDHPYAETWLLQRGFVEDLREPQSILDVTTCDLAPFAGIEDRLNAQGIAIKAYPELASDPERDHKLYELDMAVTPDIQLIANPALDPSKDVLALFGVRLRAAF